MGGPGDLEAIDDATEGSVPGFGSRPPGWVFHAVLLSVILGCWYLASDVLVDLALLAIAALCVAAVVITWFVRAFLFIRHRPRVGSAWVLLLAPAMAALFVLALTSDIPLRARFAVSQSAFEEFVSQRSTPFETYLPAKHVGLYTVRGIDKAGSGWLLTTSRGGIFTDGGFAYFPDGVPPDLSGYRLQHLNGPWWEWTYTD